MKKLTAGNLAAARQQLAHNGTSLVGPGMECVLGRASTQNPQTAGMNQTERRYAQRLTAQVHAGQIARWDFEPERLKIADNTYYVPDFRVVLPDGTVQFHEVKGFWRDDARVKIKAAAALHPYQFLAVQEVKKARGIWKVERF